MKITIKTPSVEITVDDNSGERMDGFLAGHVINIIQEALNNIRAYEKET